MNETEPKYFAEFRKEVNAKLDSHAEQLAKVSEDVTELSGKVTKIERDVQGINGRLDTHFEQIAANAENYTKTHERFERLEEKVFA